MTTWVHFASCIYSRIGRFLSSAEKPFSHVKLYWQNNFCWWSRICLLTIYVNSNVLTITYSYILNTTKLCCQFIILMKQEFVFQFYTAYICSAAICRAKCVVLKPLLENQQRTLTCGYSRENKIMQTIVITTCCCCWPFRLRMSTTWRCSVASSALQNSGSFSSSWRNKYVTSFSTLSLSVFFFCSKQWVMLLSNLSQIFVTRSFFSATYQTLSHKYACISLATLGYLSPYVDNHHLIFYSSYSRSPAAWAYIMGQVPKKLSWGTLMQIIPKFSKNTIHSSLKHTISSKKFMFFWGGA